MTKVLIKRADGSAFFSEVEHLSEDEHREGSIELKPTDIVDGKPVSEWPVGVHTVSTLEERISDWNTDTLEAENGEA